MIFRAFGVAAILPLLDLHCGGNKDNEELKLCKDKNKKLTKEKDAVKPAKKCPTCVTCVNKDCPTLTNQNNKLTTQNNKLTTQLTKQCPKTVDLTNDLTAAEKAKDTAEQAKEAAEQAKEAAEQAKEAAEQAKEAAEQAKEKAEQAKEKAEQEKETAEQAKETAIREKEVAEKALEEHLNKSFLDTVQDKAIDSLEETIDNLVAAIKMILNQIENNFAGTFSIIAHAYFVEFKETVETEMVELADTIKNKSDKLNNAESVITNFVNKIWKQTKDKITSLISNDSENNKTLNKALKMMFASLFTVKMAIKLANGTQFIEWWNLLTASVTGTCEQVKDANACTAKNGANIKQCMVDDKNTGNCFVPLPTCGDSTTLSTQVDNANLDTGISKKNDETTEFTCNEGYTPVNNTLTCNTDEETPKWTIQDGAVCQEKTCGDSTTLSTQVDNAKVPSNISVKHNGTISFTCLSGKPQNAQLTCNTAVDTPEWTVQDGAVCQGPETVDETVCTGTNAIAANNGDALSCQKKFKPVAEGIKCFQENGELTAGFYKTDQNGTKLTEVCEQEGTVCTGDANAYGGKAGEDIMCKTGYKKRDTQRYQCFEAKTEVDSEQDNVTIQFAKGWFVAGSQTDSPIHNVCNQVEPETGDDTNEGVDGEDEVVEAPAQWEVHCTVNCGQGSNIVSCMKGNIELDELKCTSTKKPTPEETCTLADCEETEIDNEGNGDAENLGGDGSNGNQGTKNEGSNIVENEGTDIVEEIEDNGNNGQLNDDALNQSRRLQI